MKYAVFDVETTNYSKGSPFDPRNHIVSICAVFVDGSFRRVLRHHFYSPDVSNCTFQDIQKEFSENKDTLLVGHNVKFDAHWLNRSGIDHGDTYWDTMFWEYIKAEGQKVDLTLSGITGEKDTLGDLLVHQHSVNPFEIAPSYLLKYNYQDVVATERLFLKQYKEVEATKIKIEERRLPKNLYVAPHKLMCDLLPVLLECEKNGFKLDREELERVQAEANEDYRILLRTIRKILRRIHGIKHFKISSNKQVYEFIYSLQLNQDKKIAWANFFTNFNQFKKDADKQLEQKIGQCFIKQNVGLHIKPVSSSIRKASLSTDRDTLKELIEKNKDNKQVRILKLFYEASRLQTLISTFIDGTLKKAYDYNNATYLNTTYNQCIARTGRLSSSNPNLHNWPKSSTFPVRRCIVSRFEGGGIGKADASQAELRYGMWYYKDNQGILDYNEGVDIHAAVATQAYGEDFTDDQRTNTKSTVFRVWYRGSAFSIVADQGIPIWELDEAKTVVDSILGRYQGVANGQEADFLLVKSQGYLDSPTGRRYRFSKLVDAKGQWHFSLKNKVANYPIQGGATGDFIPCCMIVVRREFIRRRLKSLMIGQVHDDIITDIYPGEKDQVEEILRWALTEGGREEFNSRFGLDYNIALASDFSYKKHW